MGVPAVATLGNRSANIGVPDDFDFESYGNTPLGWAGRALNKPTALKKANPKPEYKPIEYPPQREGG